MEKRLRGVHLPITTPFDLTGEIDFRALCSNIQRWSATGISGYTVLGSTGERVHLNETEYVKVIETTRTLVSAERLFVVGAGQQSTIGSIREIKTAAKAGADAALVITPHYYRFAITQERLIEHFRAIAEESPVPVILYSMPALTGIKIEPETIASLSEHPNIIGVKDSSADIVGFRKTIELSPKQFVVMTGNGTVLLDALRAGATGAILAVGCAMPEMCVEIIRAFSDGDNEHADFLQSKLTPLATAVTTKYGIGGLKAALEMRGYIGGKVRAPLAAADEQARNEIAELLEEAQRAYEHCKAVVM